MLRAETQVQGVHVGWREERQMALGDDRVVDQIRFERRKEGRFAHRK